VALRDDRVFDALGADWIVVVHGAVVELAESDGDLRAAE
jgi:hypothetical protein